MSASATPLALLAAYPVPKAPPSMRYNNLHTAHADGTLVYTTASTVPCYAPVSHALHSLGGYLSALSDIHAVPPPHLTGAFSGNGPLLAVTGPTFTDLYVNGKTVSSFQHTGDDAAGTGSGSCSAVTTVPGTHSVILAAGTSNGSVIFLDSDLNGSGDLVVFGTPVNPHERRQVTAIDVKHSDRNTGRLGALAASGDITGRVVLWNYDREPFVVIPVECDDCVTSVKICNESNLLVAIAYGSGKVNIHSGVSGALCTSIRAHSRWITALAYTPARGGLLASCAEDSIVSVWMLPAANAATDADTCASASGGVEVKHVGSAAVDDWLPTGVALGADGSSVAVACFDNLTLRVFAIP